MARPLTDEATLEREKDSMRAKMEIMIMKVTVIAVGSSCFLVAYAAVTLEAFALVNVVVVVVVVIVLLLLLLQLS